MVVVRDGGCAAVAMDFDQGSGQAAEDVRCSRWGFASAQVGVVRDGGFASGNSVSNDV